MTSPACSWTWCSGWIARLSLICSVVRVHEETLVKVDLVIRKDEPFRQAEFDRRQTVSVHGQAVRIVSREDLLLSNLLWGAESGSAVQVNDARQLAGLALDWPYVERWAAVLNLTEAVEECDHDRHVGGD